MNPTKRENWFLTELSLSSHLNQLIMKFEILDWRIEPVTSADVRTVTYLLEEDGNPEAQKVATIVFTGSLLATMKEDNLAPYNSEEWVSRLGVLGISLLQAELSHNKQALGRPDRKYVYDTETYPYGGIYIQNITEPKGYKFEI